MRSLELAKRNFKEVWRDPVSLSITIALPALLLLVLQAFGGEEIPYLTATLLTPGILLVGFVMLLFSSALILSRDRESALFSRLLTAPLRSSDFVSAYSLPYVPVAIIQGILIFGIAAFLGLESNGSFVLVFLVMLVMAVFYIGLGMILGSLLSPAPLSGAYTAVLLLTIFGGAWFDLAEIGGVFQTVGNALPFAHALDAARAVMVEGAGFSEIAADFYWVFGYALVAFALAVFVFRRKMVE
jgi:ABC-2 type transport system permease protein